MWFSLFDWLLIYFRLFRSQKEMFRGKCKEEEGVIPAAVFRPMMTQQLPETAFLRRWDSYLTAAKGAAFFYAVCLPPLDRRAESFIIMPIRNEWEDAP